MKQKNPIILAALLVAGIRLWMQVRGKTTTPFSEWAIGYGALFVCLALMADLYPPAAGALAGTVVVGDFLKNGKSLFEDVTEAITGAEQGQPVFTDNPFGAAASTGNNPSPTRAPSMNPIEQPTGKLPGRGVLAPAPTGPISTNTITSGWGN